MIPWVVAVNGIFFGTGGASVGTESDAVRPTKHCVEKDEIAKDKTDDIVAGLERLRRDVTAITMTKQN